MHPAPLPSPAPASLLPNEAFERFRHHMLANPAQLQPLLEITSEPEFTNQVVAAGLRCGFHFSAAEVQAALRSSRRSWLERWI